MILRWFPVAFLRVRLFNSSAGLHSLDTKLERLWLWFCDRWLGDVLWISFRRGLIILSTQKKLILSKFPNLWVSELSLLRQRKSLCAASVTGSLIESRWYGKRLAKVWVWEQVNDGGSNPAKPSSGTGAGGAAAALRRSGEWPSQCRGWPTTRARWKPRFRARNCWPGRLLVTFLLYFILYCVIVFRWRMTFSFSEPPDAETCSGVVGVWNCVRSSQHIIPDSIVCQWLTL